MPIIPPNLSIPKTTVAEMPLAVFSGSIEVIDTPEKVDKAIECLRQSDVIGFDTETKPSFKKGHPNKMALMQLSTDEQCFLFRLNKIGFPSSLKAIIEDPKVTKIGLSVHDDFHVMQRSGDFNPEGFVELQNYVKEFGIADISLQKIYAILFGEKISKSQRLTNWEASTLTQPQQVYAATDAWACLRIYRYLSSGMFNPAECPYIIEDTNDTSQNISHP